MEYMKINNEIELEQKKKLVISSYHQFNIDDKNTIEKKHNNPPTKGNILIFILLILFISFVISYQIVLSYFTKKNNNILPQEEHAHQEKENFLPEQLNDTQEENIPFPQDIYKIESFSSITRSFNKAKNFLEKCINGTLLREIPSKSIDNVLATAVIPVYNSKNYISKAIKSIQNQNIENIEIILVDDKSTDDTLSFIKEIQKEDQRIKIIANQKNMGIFYTRCIGTLSAKGKYIFPLDNDDMFLDEDVFQTIINIAEKGNFDIVEFKGIESKKGDKGILDNKISDIRFATHPLNLVLYQPALGNYQIWPKKSINAFHVEIVFLWAKCIKTEIYQKTINKIGKEKYSRHIIVFEDLIMNYALFNTAKSYKFVGKYGIFNIYRPRSASRTLTKVKSDIYHIYYLDIIMDFVQDRFEHKKVIVNFIMRLLGRKSLEKALKTSKDLYDIFISCVDKALNMTKISDELKNEIRKKGKELKFINYPF